MNERSKSSKQRRVLSALEEASGRLVLNERLIEAMYEPPEQPPLDPNNVLRVVMHYLRRRLAMAGDSREICNVWGRGYALRPGVATEAE